jgi:2-polyprenyl-3-methyl-5-hydroxy-6-metoxy-1,4-benzoquinol methylase
LTRRGRTVRPEILDALEPGDPRAIRSRRDLRRVNAAIGSSRVLTRTLRAVLASRPPREPLRLLELGAGDGTLALKLARRLAASSPAAQLTLLDRQPLLAPATGIAFADLGWALRPLIVDALEWARAPTQQLSPARWDVMLANLFLHHFEEPELRELLSAAAARCDIFIACEPRRSLPARLGARLLPALGVSRETRHDAIVSVHAGFRGGELSAMWPAPRGDWRLSERPIGLFSHLFVAVRGI